MSCSLPISDVLMFLSMFSLCFLFREAMAVMESVFMSILWLLEVYAYSRAIFMAASSVWMEEEKSVTRRAAVVVLTTCYFGSGRGYHHIAGGGVGGGGCGAAAASLSFTVHTNAAPTFPPCGSADLSV